MRHTVVSIYASLRHLQVVAGLAPLQLRQGTDEDQWPPGVPASGGQQVTWSTPKLGSEALAPPRVGGIAPPQGLK